MLNPDSRGQLKDDRRVVYYSVSDLGNVTQKEGIYNLTRRDNGVIPEMSIRYKKIMQENINGNVF